MKEVRFYASECYWNVACSFPPLAYTHSFHTLSLQLNLEWNERPRIPMKPDTFRRKTEVDNVCTDFAMLRAARVAELAWPLTFSICACIYCTGGR